MAVGEQMDQYAVRKKLFAFVGKQEEGVCDLFKTVETQIRVAANIARSPGLAYMVYLLPCRKPRASPLKCVAT